MHLIKARRPARFRQFRMHTSASESRAGVNDLTHLRHGTTSPLGVYMFGRAASFRISLSNA